MNTEQKAKAYDEALDRAKKELQTCGSTDCDAARQIFRFFPTLRESEDERIRKEIIDFIQWAEDRGMTRHDYHQAKRPAVWIAYLEKQKETANSFTDGVIEVRSFQRGIAEGRRLERQKECVADSSKTSANEDESIRKFLVDYFTSYKIGNVATKLNGVRIDDILNYLEKQKELPFVKDVVLGLPGLYFYDGERMHFGGSPAMEENPYDFAMSQQEKQKEQKHPNGCFTCDEYKKGYEEGRRNGFTAGYNKAMKEVEQKEQKPVVTLGETYHVDTLGTQQVIAGKMPQKPAEWDDYTKTNLGRAIQIIKDARGTLHGYQTDDGIYECDKAIEALEHFLYRGLEIEKSAEWSEEDEKRFKRVLEIVDRHGTVPVFDGKVEKRFNAEYIWLKNLRERLKSFRPQSKQEQNDYITPHKEFFKFIYDRLINVHKENPNVDYMRSFKERLNNLSFGEKQEWSEEDENKIESIKGLITMGKFVDTNTIKTIWKLLDSLRPQPKVEWSKEDEEMRNALWNLLHLHYAQDNAQTLVGIEAGKFRSWLKSLRPVSKESLQPHWKPSKEQMKALDKAIPVCMGVVGRDEIIPLESLYEQLKKL